MNLPALLHTDRVGDASSDALAVVAQQSVAQLHEAADARDAHNSRPAP